MAAMKATMKTRRPPRLISGSPGNEPIASSDSKTRRQRGSIVGIAAEPMAKVRSSLRSGPGEWREGVAECPAALGDAGAVVRRPSAGASTVVALDRPHGERVDALVGREAQDLLRVGERRHLRLLRVVVDAVHDRDADPAPELRGGLARVQLLELRLQPLGGADRRVAHL